MSGIIEGRNPVIEALRAGAPMTRIMIAETARDAVPLALIERLAAQRAVPIERVKRSMLDSASERGAHQGVVAHVAPFAYATLDEVVQANDGSQKCLIIALDHVTDPGNLGAVVRSAEVAGAAAVIVTRRRSAPVGASTYKTAAGALSWIPVVQETNMARTLTRLKDAGFWIAGADGGADTLAWDAPLEGRLVIVLGSEGQGLSRLVSERCDFLVRLPVAGHVDSLNVAQAASVLAFEWVRRCRRES
jgi:23S rRNA (guanosine2251-2'-O)-methyltransferase